mmetsp:Transcript_18645/g.40818  ORF Transcript_18645/g.40818 Transcript_18645/m.40818 type:complete len:286 (-) Transcript_18645:1465-2322(-)
MPSPARMSCEDGRLPSRGDSGGTGGASTRSRPTGDGRDWGTGQRLPPPRRLPRGAGPAAAEGAAWGRSGGGCRGGCRGSGRGAGCSFKSATRRDGPTGCGGPADWRQAPASQSSAATSACPKAQADWRLGPRTSAATSAVAATATDDGGVAAAAITAATTAEKSSAAAAAWRSLARNRRSRPPRGRAAQRSRRGCNRGRTWRSGGSSTLPLAAGPGASGTASGVATAAATVRLRRAQRLPGGGSHSYLPRSHGRSLAGSVVACVQFPWGSLAQRTGGRPWAAKDR